MHHDHNPAIAIKLRELGDRNLFLGSELPAIIASLYSDDPITELKVLPGYPGDSPVPLQKVLLNARSLEELTQERLLSMSMMTVGNNDASGGLYIGMGYGLHPLKAPDTRNLRKDLGFLLSDDPHFLFRYDMYTWNDPELWQGFVDLYWRINRTLGSHSSPPDVRLHDDVSSFLSKGDFSGCSSRASLIGLSSQFSDMVQNLGYLQSAAPLIPLTRDQVHDRCNMKAIRSMMGETVGMLRTTLSDLGHEYRAYVLSEDVPSEIVLSGF